MRAPSPDPIRDLGRTAGDVADDPHCAAMRIGNRDAVYH